MKIEEREGMEERDWAIKLLESVQDASSITFQKYFELKRDTDYFKRDHYFIRTPASIDGRRKIELGGRQEALKIIPFLKGRFEKYRASRDALEAQGYVQVAPGKFFLKKKGETVRKNGKIVSETLFF